MIPFWAETLLLMAAFYFLGAVLGCISRRSLAPAAVRGVPAERRVDPLPDVVARHDAQSAQPRHGADPGPAPQAARASVAGGSRAAASRFQRQDLKNIQGIDAVTEARLNGLGIVRFEQIAGWLRADVQRVGEAIGQKRRIAQENWIEQAQILAKDGQTLFSVRRARGEGSTAAPTPDESGPALPASEASLPRAMSRAGVAAVVVAPPASTEASSSVQRVASAVPIRPVDAPAHDDLRRIGGVTAEIETRLNALGISRYSEIAQWSPAAVERIDKELGTSGRISRENWIEQAQILSRGGDTRFSREFDRHASAPAGPPPRPIKLPDAIREHEAARVTQAPAPVSAPRHHPGGPRGRPAPRLQDKGRAHRAARQSPAHQGHRHPH